MSTDSLRHTSPEIAATSPDGRSEDAHSLVIAPPGSLMEAEACEELVDEVREEAEEAREEAAEAMSNAQRLRHLTEIGIALSSERDIERLLQLILSKSRELTKADAGSLYIVQKHTDDQSSQQRDLYFRMAQNDSVLVDTSRSFPVSQSTLAGYVALTGEPIRCEDAYELPPDAPYGFSDSFDKMHHYRTKSVLVMPMKNHANEVIGVLQLINRKRHSDVLLQDAEAVEREVIPFDDDLENMIASLTSQAAVAYENTQLLERVTKLLNDIELSFDSFVKASASAIEDRDPTTAGHSMRVTILTIGLAQAINEAEDGYFRDKRFSETELKELRISTLLHDFGKIGVRESVLTKSHKLEPLHFQEVKSRLLLRRRSRELDYANRKIEALRAFRGEPAATRLNELEQEWLREAKQIDEDLAILTRANDPAITFLPDDEFNAQQEVLKRLAEQTYIDENGSVHPLVTEEELIALSIRKGSLTQDEFRQIQEHSQISYEFLDQILWPEAYANVPEIAWCHHEKLNGKGYPRGVCGEEIPLQSRLMTVADIYDALTASDRPYKKAMPLERALDILRWEARDGALDPEVVELFIKEKVYLLTAGWHSTSTTTTS